MHYFSIIELGAFVLFAQLCFCLTHFLWSCFVWFALMLKKCAFYFSSVENVFWLKRFYCWFPERPPFLPKRWCYLFLFFFHSLPLLLFLFLWNRKTTPSGRDWTGTSGVVFFASFIHFSLPNRSGRLDEPWPWWMENLFQRQFILLHTQKMRNAFCRLLFRYGVVLEKHTPVKF